MMKLLITLAMSLTIMASPFVRAQEIEIEKLDPNMTLKKADAEGIAWFDPRTAPFRLGGFPWIDEDKLYRRLPVKSEWTIPPAVDSLANSTAGGQIQFQSDSPKVPVRAHDKNLPILIISKIRYASELHNPASLKTAKAREQFQADFVKTRREAGGTLLGDHDDECTVDGVHPTDLGFMKMAGGIEPAIKEILKERP